MPIYPSPGAVRSIPASGVMAFNVTHFDFSTLGAADWTGLASTDIGHGVTADIIRAAAATVFGPDGATGIRFSMPAGSNITYIYFPVSALHPGITLYSPIFFCLDMRWDNWPIGGFSGCIAPAYPVSSDPDTNKIWVQAFRAGGTTRTFRMNYDGGVNLERNNTADIRRLMSIVDMGAGLRDAYFSLTAGGGVVPVWDDPPSDGFLQTTSSPIAQYTCPRSLGWAEPAGVSFGAYGSGTDVVDVTFTDLWVATPTT